LWDCPTKAISTADKKKRVVIPVARPGDVFDVSSWTKSPERPATPSTR
jgi:hypothetical protein